MQRSKKIRLNMFLTFYDQWGNNRSHGPGGPFFDGFFGVGKAVDLVKIKKNYKYGAAL